MYKNVVKYNRERITAWNEFYCVEMKYKATEKRNVRCFGKNRLFCEKIMPIFCVKISLLWWISSLWACYLRLIWANIVNECSCFKFYFISSCISFLVNCWLYQYCTTVSEYTVRKLERIKVKLKNEQTSMKIILLRQNTALNG